MGVLCGCLRSTYYYDYLEVSRGWCLVAVIVTSRAFSLAMSMFCRPKRHCYLKVVG